MFDLVIPDPNGSGRWLTAQYGAAAVRVHPKRTYPATVNHTVNRTFGVGSQAYQARVIFRISWQKWYGLFGVGFWKTKKRASDLYPGAVLNNIGGSLVFSPKNWVLGPTCGVRHQ